MALISTSLLIVQAIIGSTPYKYGTQDSNDYLTLNILSKSRQYLVIRFSAPISVLINN